MGDEEQAVDFGDGARLAEGAGELDEQVDDLDLHGVQGRRPGSPGATVLSTKPTLTGQVWQVSQFVQ